MQESFEPIERVSECMKLEMNTEKVKGFFFRAEDFGDYVAKVDDYAKSWAYQAFKELPHSRMLEAVNNNTREYKNMMWNYGQKLSSFSYGEAFLHIITERTKKQGLYIFDEPESALSPIHQLSLIYLIREHLKREDSQFIIATHSPILMAMPGALIYEITETGMNATPLEQV
jgi:ABC superfamily ATP binding cassette transporter, ABC protein